MRDKVIDLKMADEYCFYNGRKGNLRLTAEKVNDRFLEWLENKVDKEDDTLWKICCYVNNDKFKNVYLKGNKYEAFMKVHKYINEEPTIDEFYEDESLEKTFEHKIDCLIQNDTLWLEKAGLIII
jgi:hypothetical protein